MPGSGTEEALTTFKVNGTAPVLLPVLDQKITVPEYKPRALSLRTRALRVSGEGNVNVAGSWNDYGQTVIVECESDGVRRHRT